MEPSVVDVAPTCPFPLNNLPYGVFTHPTHNPETPQIGVAIGTYILSLHTLHQNYSNSLPSTIPSSTYTSTVLNPLLECGPKSWKDLRASLKAVLKKDGEYTLDQLVEKNVLLDMKECKMLMPLNVGDYTDFYSSREHAENIGEMFRGKDKKLLENWLWMPVGYHGRASSIVVSGTEVRRPKGQQKIVGEDGKEQVVFDESKRLDFEMEVASVVGKGCEFGGEGIKVDEALDCVFGLVLMNDWSARDIQKWEYVPLGPFNGKNFCTTISPWIVTMDALKPFMVDGIKQDEDKVLSYLKEEKRTTFDIGLSVGIKSKGMKQDAIVSRMNFKELYWTIAQQVAHHSASGCNLKPGDLLASGTISGKSTQSYGSLIELAWKGTKPVKLGDSGETRKFLQDGDEVVMRGECKGEGYTIGFGECSGLVTPRT